MIKNENSGNYYIGTGTLDEYDYLFKAANIESFLITTTVRATGVILEYDSSGDLDGSVGLVGSGSDFEVDGIKDPEGGTVFVIAGNLDATLDLAVELRPFIIQDTPISNQGDGHRKRLEDEHDRSRQIDLYLDKILSLSIIAPKGTNPANWDNRMPKLEALKFLQTNSTKSGIQFADVAAQGTIVVPGGVGLAAYLGSNTFTNRTLQKIGNAIITNGNGFAGDPTVDVSPLDAAIALNAANIVLIDAKILETDLPFFPTEQTVPDDTVLLTKGQTHSQKSPEGSPVDVAAGAADAITFPVVSANSRIDYLKINNDTQVITKVAGTEDPSPVPAAYPTDTNEDVICEVTISDTGTVVVNDADIRYVMKRTPPAIRKTGRTLLTGRVNAAGSIDTNEDGGSGASFTVSKATGIYDITLTGLGEFTKIIILTQLNNNAAGNYNAIKAVTAKSADTGFPTTTGFRVRTVHLDDLTGGGAGIYSEVDTDNPFSFEVIGVS